MSDGIAAIARVLSSWYVTLATGLALLISSLMEIFDEALDPLIIGLLGWDVDVGIVHGALFMGIVHTLKAMTEMSEGIKDISETGHRRRDPTARDRD